METEYKINTMTNVIDRGNYIINSLLDMLYTKSYEWIDRTDIFTIKKGIHPDGSGNYHFTFSHKGYSYHAYTTQVVTHVNGRPYVTRLRITHITRLEIWT